MIQDEQVQTLLNLGLTHVQARAYMSLAKLGIADTKTVAKCSDIARQDIYRIMSTLEIMGLAEKVIAKTTKYKATPVKDGLTILLERKKSNVVESEKQVQNFFTTFQDNSEKKPLEISFSLTYEVSHLRKMHSKLAATAENNIDFMIPVHIDKEQIYQEAEYVKAAINRGVKIRAIGQERSVEKIGENSKVLAEDSLLKIRCLPKSAFRCGMHIFDCREITLAVSDQPIPSLWTNSPHVVELASAYFENMWKTAKE